MSRRVRRVAAYVDALLRNRRPPRGRQDADDLEALAAAIELSAARPQAGLPDPRFVERLEARLREHAGGDVPAGGRLSRRGLLRAGGLAAAAAATGVVVDRLAVDHPPGSPGEPEELAVDGGRWHAVVALDALPVGRAARFSTGRVEGVVVHRGGGDLLALSAVCTHLGCILQLDQNAGRLDCPCHRAAFGLGGEVLYHEQPQPLRPLPRIPVRIRDGQVEVHVV
ncbi:MAG TPA: Rieske (2Fe-2S) protein [Candidatus Dormibacteraeota bacterium]